MEKGDIGALIKILEHKKRPDLANLLKGAMSGIDSSSQYGSRLYSIISSFLIYAPLENFYKLKGITEKDKHSILEAVLDIHPVEDNAPEIVSIDFRLLKEQESEEETREEKAIYIGRTVRVFIGYSTKDKALAGELKKALEQFGLEVFLAHEDINPSSEWQQTILDNLESTDIFIPLITENFSQSFWTDQESGIAFIKSKVILPVAINGHNPYGFLNKYQAFKQDSSSPISGCEVVEAIIQVRHRLSSSLLDSLIKSFAMSGSFQEAGEKSKLLLSFDSVTKDQFNEIFKNAIQNKQIFESWEATYNLKILFKNHKNLIDNDIETRILIKYDEDSDAIPF